MENLLSRVVEDLIARSNGPLSFRFILQPLMAATLGLLDGLKDARNGRPAYFWTVFTDRSQRLTLLREGWKAIAKIFILALVLDTVYQVIVFHQFHLGEAIIVATVLAILPYLLLRGPVNRIRRPMLKRSKS